jgi:hypothetical protein
MKKMEDDLKIMEDNLKNVGRKSGNYMNSQIRALHLCTDPVLVYRKYQLMYNLLN